MAGRMRTLTWFARAVAMAAATVWVCVFAAGPGIAAGLGSAAGLSSAAGLGSAAGGARPDGGEVAAMSCRSPGECAAVGDLTFGNDFRPLVASEKGGAWGGAGTVPGPPGAKSAGLYTVSCSSAGNCGAGGAIQLAEQALVVTERHGVWGRATPVPGLAAMNIGREASVDLISCRSAGNCTAAGTYTDKHTQVESGQVFVVSEKNGSWGQAQPVAGLAAIDHDRAHDTALSCGSPGNCVLAGRYSTGSINTAVFVASQKGGTWSAVHTFPAITAKQANFDTLSCRPGGACTATGNWFDSENDLHIFAVSRTHGTWGPVTQIWGFARLPHGRPTFGSGTSLSCPSASDCTLVGTYFGSHDGADEAFVVTEKNGTWGRVRPLPGVAALNTGRESESEFVACFRRGNCTAAGDYETHTGSGFHEAVYVAAEKNGTWSKAERLPESAKLSKDLIITTLSCGASGGCSVGGSFIGKSARQPFVATEKKGTWGNPQLLTGPRQDHF